MDKWLNLSYQLSFDDVLQLFCFMVLGLVIFM